MPIYRLISDLIAQSSEAPEYSMGIQVARFAIDRWDGRHYLPIIDSRVAILFDQVVPQQIRDAQDFGLWDTRESGPKGVDEDRIESWISQLPPVPPIDLVDPEQIRNERLFAFWTAGGPVPPPPFTPGPYGHLPFTAASGSNDVYYRYEAFPNSRRIHQNGKSVSPGTYASPASELGFMPTGLSVVARCALPSLLPARWRWEIQPMPNTSFRCGASVPLHGQSGGGVEVMFPVGVTNRGPIANPIMLPVL